MIRRINFFGGPQTGKSTIATRIFSEMKSKNFSVEYVHEYIKFWTYLGLIPKSFDTLYVTAKQIHREDVILNSGVDYIVSDSPILLACAYLKKYNFCCANEIINITKKFEIKYPSLNILLLRGEYHYEQKGRYETEEQAREMDNIIVDTMSKEIKNYKIFKCTEVDKIITYVVSSLNNNDG